MTSSLHCATRKHMCRSELGTAILGRSAATSPPQDAHTDCDAGRNHETQRRNAEPAPKLTTPTRIRALTGLVRANLPHAFRAALLPGRLCAALALCPICEGLHSLEAAPTQQSYESPMVRYRRRHLQHGVKSGGPAWAATRDAAVSRSFVGCGMRRA